MDVLKSIAKQFLTKWNSVIDEKSDDEPIADMSGVAKQGRVVLASFWHVVRHHPDINNEIKGHLQTGREKVDQLAEALLNNLRHRQLISTRLFGISADSAGAVAFIRAINEWLATDHSIQNGEFKYEIYNEGGLDTEHTIEIFVDAKNFPCRKKNSTKVLRYFGYQRIRPHDRSRPYYRQALPIYICLSHHRIIPQEWGGLEIVVAHLPKNLRCREDLLRRFSYTARQGTETATAPSAKLFLAGHERGRDISKMEPEKKTYTSSGIEIKETSYFSEDGGVNKSEVSKGIARKLRQASNANCDFVVFPELTISPSLAHELIVDAGLDPEIRDTLLFISGSFHAKDGERKVNRAHLISGEGIIVSVQDKLKRYYTSKPNSDGIVDVEIEAIDEANTVQLLEISDVLIGIAICKDLCDRATLNIWEMLDVSMVLVPSSGDNKTASAHVRMLHEMKLLGRTLVGISQEVFPVSKGQLPFWYGIYNGIDIDYLNKGPGKHKAADKPSWRLCECHLR